MSTSPVSTAFFAAVKRALVVFPIALTTTMGLSGSAWRRKSRVLSSGQCYNTHRNKYTKETPSKDFLSSEPFELCQHTGELAHPLQRMCHQISSPEAVEACYLPHVCQESFWIQIFLLSSCNLNSCLYFKPQDQINIVVSESECWEKTNGAIVTKLQLNSVACLLGYLGCGARAMSGPPFGEIKENGASFATCFDNTIYILYVFPKSKDVASMFLSNLTRVLDLKNQKDGLLRFPQADVLSPSLGEVPRSLQDSTSPWCQTCSQAKITDPPNAFWRTRAKTLENWKHLKTMQLILANEQNKTNPQSRGLSKMVSFDGNKPPRLHVIVMNIGERHYRRSVLSSMGALLRRYSKHVTPPSSRRTHHSLYESDGFYHGLMAVLSGRIKSCAGLDHWSMIYGCFHCWLCLHRSWQFYGNPMVLFPYKQSSPSVLLQRSQKWLLESQKWKTEINGCGRKDGWLQHHSTFGTRKTILNKCWIPYEIQKSDWQWANPLFLISMYSQSELQRVNSFWTSQKKRHFRIKLGWL